MSGDNLITTSTGLSQGLSLSRFNVMRNFNNGWFNLSSLNPQNLTSRGMFRSELTDFKRFSFEKVNNSILKFSPELEIPLSNVGKVQTRKIQIPMLNLKPAHLQLPVTLNSPLNALRNYQLGFKTISTPLQYTPTEVQINAQNKLINRWNNFGKTFLNSYSLAIPTEFVPREGEIIKPTSRTTVTPVVEVPKTLTFERLTRIDANNIQRNLLSINDNAGQPKYKGLTFVDEGVGGKYTFKCKGIAQADLIAAVEGEVLQIKEANMRLLQERRILLPEQKKLQQKINTERNIQRNYDQDTHNC
ncbi:MAG: hypothetical protein ACTSXQ_03500 [Alphaproteobacteria bacterium]